MKIPEEALLVRCRCEGCDVLVELTEPVFTLYLHDPSENQDGGVEFFGRALDGGEHWAYDPEPLTEAAREFMATCTCKEIV